MSLLVFQWWLTWSWWLIFSVEVNYKRLTSTVIEGDWLSEATEEMHVTSIHLYENELASSRINGGKKECDWWFAICVCVWHIASCLWLEFDPDVWWCPWATALKLFNIQQHCVSVCTIWPPFQRNDPATTMWLDHPVKQIGASVWQYRQSDWLNIERKGKVRWYCWSYHCH